MKAARRFCVQIGHGFYTTFLRPVACLRPFYGLFSYSILHNQALSRKRKTAIHQPLQAVSRFLRWRSKRDLNYNYDANHI